MQLPKQKMSIIFLWLFLTLTCSTFLNLLIHEGSHLITLLMCNGKFEAMSLGITSFIEGYINSESVSIVAISSLIIPTIVSILFFFMKSFYGSVCFLGFTLPNITNASFGLFASLFISDMNTLATYDIALSYDYAKFPWLIIVITIIFLIINLLMLMIKIIKLLKAE